MPIIKVKTKKGWVPINTNGITPHIGSNGNWFIGSKDTGYPSRGNSGSSVAYPFELVTNTYDGGLDKALAAEIGKELNSELQDVKTHISTQIEDIKENGFFVCDNDGYIGLSVINGILDCLGLGPTLIKILEASSGFVTDVMENTEEDGFFICDEEYNIGAVLSPTQNSFGALDYRIV